MSLKIKERKKNLKKKIKIEINKQQLVLQTSKFTSENAKQVKSLQPCLDYTYWVKDGGRQSAAKAKAETEARAEVI